MHYVTAETGAACGRLWRGPEGTAHAPGRAMAALASASALACSARTRARSPPGRTPMNSRCASASSDSAAAAG